MTQNNNSVAEVKTVAPASNEDNNVVVTASTNKNMDKMNVLTSTPQAGAEEQLVNGKSVVGQHTENNFTEQEDHAQATTGACPVENVIGASKDITQEPTEDLYAPTVVDYTAAARKIMSDIEDAIASEVEDDDTTTETDVLDNPEGTEAAEEELTLDKTVDSDKFDADSEDASMPGDGSSEEGDAFSDENLPALLFAIGITDYTCRVIISFVDAVKSGKIKLCFIEGNREVSNAQLNKLIKDLEERGTKKFTNAGIIVPLALLHQYNPNVVCKDINGKVISQDNPDYNRYFAIADAQHRVMACLEKGFDMDLEIHNYKGDIFEYIEILNSFDKNWNNQDLKHMHRSTGKITNQLYEDAEQAAKWYGASPKYLEYALMLEQDKAKKKDLIKGVDKVDYDQEKARRGELILGATFASFGSESSVRKVQYIDAIKSMYVATPDSKKATFATDVASYIVNLTDKQKESIINLLKEKNYGTLDDYMKDSFRNYTKDNRKFLDENHSEIEAKVDAVIENTIANSGQTVTALKIATPWELMKNRKEIRDQKAAKKQTKK